MIQGLFFAKMSCKKLTDSRQKTGDPGLEKANSAP